MTQLVTLRARLHSLRLARASIRWGSALALLLTIALAGWWIAYCLDWVLQWNLWFRAAVLVGWATALAGLFHRWVWPDLGPSESLEEVALVVERAHGIDSDLVAALQFDSPAVPVPGSQRLSSAVVAYVAEFSQTLDVFRDFSWGQLPRRGLLAVGMLLVTATLVGMAPAHASAFWNRFWLGSARFPTRTQITELIVNGTTVPLGGNEAIRLAIPQNVPLNIRVQHAGETPDRVVAFVRGKVSRERTEWNFQPAPDSATRWHDFEISPVMESVEFVVRAGDATLEPIVVDIVPLPLIDVNWSVAAPTYALQGPLVEVAAGARHFSALQGSELGLQVTGVNKPLNEVTLKLPTGDIPLDRSETTDGEHWNLPPDSPLTEFREPLTYTLAVTDADGLHPQPEITGEIRLHTDRVPKVAAAMISRKLLSEATPRITYGATDDFGLRSLRWDMELIRADGSRQRESQEIWRNSQGTVERTLRGEIGIPLAPYKLTKGDEVRIILIAEDDRGEFPVGEGMSETLSIDITDRNGILESLLEFDQQSARQLDEIIERELGIGRISR